VVGRRSHRGGHLPARHHRFLPIGLLSRRAGGMDRRAITIGLTAAIVVSNVVAATFPGARCVVKHASLGADGPTGGFFLLDERLPW
jgi:hypothetical protein